MSVRVKDITIDPPVLLAPMAGITDLPFRNLVASFGAGLVVSEMVASQEMVQAKPGVRERAELGFGHANTAVQLAARDVYWAGEAARMVEQNGAQVIDINMGCPARKVVGGMSGSALMRDLDHALRLIEAIVGAVSVPVTLKTRLGWDDDSLNAATLARMAEAAGIQMITIHGRTRCQFYKGRANWSAIRPVKDAVSIPVIANGDIVDTATARQALSDSGADGVMIGRSSGGQPWLLAQVAHEIWGTSAPTIPCGLALANMVADHYRASLDFYGHDLGARVIRKHLGWYMDLVGTDAGLRRRILSNRDTTDVLSMLPDAMLSERRAA
ncbi:tRNA dihydrouridine synthase DusB [Aliiroseovarius sp. F47248L]|uniref:tRNA dihydrouridine synthase DusB n=1 Tax=Aliiroseovarius sp. F47248L TaxID=2926420 RepID=UPI001FF20268|nr:tRNA dihydrouridine synthase DusB [Aliiroseovarius sp. F47248L]MCK0138832.1 tRNA dihydrouridine synthase DusB [Aliiroseovarius sp. F47248L]